MATRMIRNESFSIRRTSIVLILLFNFQVQAFYQTINNVNDQKNHCKQVAHGFVRSTSNNNNNNNRLFTSSSSSPETAEYSGSLIKYDYDGWNLSYRTVACNSCDAGNYYDRKGHNVLLIHPVGIGLASWFWEPFLESVSEKYSNSNHTISDTNFYAPNLIGCGCMSEGSDAWNPDKRGLFIPLGWVRGCEAFIEMINKSNDERSSWTVVAQGALAPIGILLADRNPNLISRLVLASPSSWTDLGGVAEDKLKRSYNFYRSIFGRLFFQVLESRRAVEFFSNLFLFSNECDQTWLDKAELEFGKNARPPVQVVNSGMCVSRGLQSKLSALQQPTLIVQGEDDKRQRSEYSKNMKNCQIVKLSGCLNVCPWSDPAEFTNLLVDWIESN